MRTIDYEELSMETDSSSYIMLKEINIRKVGFNIVKVQNCNKQLQKNSLVGILSFVFGILSILVSIIVYCSLRTSISWNYGIGFNILSQIFNKPQIVLAAQMLIIFNYIDFVIKPIGLVISIIGLLQRNSKKIFSITGFVLNVIGILWMVALMLGLPIL